MQLVLDTNGLTVKKKKGCFWVVGKNHQTMISPNRVSSIAVTADCLLSAAAIRLAITHQVPIFFFDTLGRLEGRLDSPWFGSIATIRRQQMLLYETPQAVQLVCALFELKGINQQKHLRVLLRRKRNLKPEIEIAIAEIEQTVPKMQTHRESTLDECRKNLMGIEGQAAKQYWQAVSTFLPEPWAFTSRSRRPAKDMFNAVINYLYGMLYSEVTRATVAAGLDQALGFLHVDQHRKPTLVYDLIEPFRPWIDELVTAACLDKRFDESCFEKRDNGFWVSKKGKAVIIPMFNAFMLEPLRFNHKQIRRRNHIFELTGKLAQFLLKRDKNVQTTFPDFV